MSQQPSITHDPDQPVYLDYCATTPVDERVFAWMAPFFTQHYGNAGSRYHAFGWDARDAVEDARREVATLIGAQPHEIIFTSGATESINLALKGLLMQLREPTPHVITTAVEHRAVLDVCRFLEQEGVAVTYLPVNTAGQIDLDELEANITANTRLVAVMAANNEVGTVYPLEEIGRIAQAYDLLFFTDATQAAGTIPLDVHHAGVDLLACSAHKLYGPKGVGALFVHGGASRIDLAPQTHGGGHEYGVRSGTLNVPGIVGFGRACRLAQAAMPEETRRLASLRDRLERGLLDRLPNVHQNGARARRLPHVASLTFDGVESRELVPAVYPVAVSAGAACSSAAMAPSHVLKALGLSDAHAYSTIRFSLGRFTTEAEIDYTVSVFEAAVARLRR